MSARISIVDRISSTVAVQIQSLRLRSASTVGVLGQEAAVFRAVVTGIEVVKSCGLVIDSSAVADFIVQIVFTLFGGFTVVRVAVSLL